MLAYIAPVALIVLSNIIYQICAKCVPFNMNPFASLTVTYLIGAVFSGILFHILNPGQSLLGEYTKTNWAPFVLGLVVVGLEVGYIYAFKVGWPVSATAIVQGSFLAVALIFVGYFFFNEAITLNKLLGIVICMIGLFFINR